MGRWNVMLLNCVDVDYRFERLLVVFIEFM